MKTKATQTPRFVWRLRRAEDLPERGYDTLESGRSVMGLGGSFWPTLIRNKSNSKVLVALSCPAVSVTNRTPGSWWLFLAHSYP